MDGHSYWFFRNSSIDGFSNRSAFRKGIHRDWDNAACVYLLWFCRPIYEKISFQYQHIGHYYVYAAHGCRYRFDRDANNRAD